VATLKDVAKRSGLSVGTVSRYINGMDIKEKNRLKVEEAIRFFDFHVNQIARTLKTNRTHTVGVVIPNLKDIYATTIIKSIEEELYACGYNIFVCDASDSVQIETEKIEILQEKMVDGLILYPVTEDLRHLSSAFSNALSKKTPCVVLDVQSHGCDCDHVLVDNADAAKTATEYLIRRGHRKIAVITGKSGYYTADQRLNGYQSALREAGIPLQNEYVKAYGFTEKDGYDSFVSLMRADAPPTALLVCNYYTTIGAMKAAYELELPIPERVSLIGYDSLGVSQITRPALTLVVQPMEEMGRAAARLLYRRMSGDDSGFPQTIFLKAGLMEKNSVRTL
jgi:LacI family transcriptional regulator